MTLKLTANLRTKLGHQAVAVRDAGKIPAVVYGHKIENSNLELNYVEFVKILEQAGESTILDVTVDSKEPIKALISAVQYSPVSGRVSHVDLHQVNMKEKINAHVEIKFVGESKVVKEDGGMIIHSISEVEIRCLPGDLIHEITVDTAVLKEFDQTITIADLKLPASIEILHHDSHDVVAIAVEPKAQVEEVPVVTAPVAGATAEASTEEKK